MSQPAPSVNSRARGLSFLNLDGGSTSPSRLDAPPPQRARRSRQNSHVTDSPSSLNRLDLSAQYSDGEPRALRSPVHTSPPKSSRQKILDGIEQYRVPLASTSAAGYAHRDLPETPVTLLTPPLNASTKGSPLRSNRLGSLPDIAQAQSGVYSQDTLGDVRTSPRLTSFSRRLRSKTSVNEMDRSQDSVVRAVAGLGNRGVQDRTSGSDQPNGLGILNLESYASVQPEYEEPPSRSRSHRPSFQSDRPDDIGATTTIRNGTVAPSSSRTGKLSRLTYKKADATSFAAQSRATPHPASADRDSAGSSSSATKGLGIGTSDTSQGYAQGDPSAHDLPPTPADPYATYSGLVSTSRSDYIDAGSGHVTPANGDFSLDASTQNTSRAASLRSIQGGYHDRFSRQSNPSDRNSTISTAEQLSSSHGSGGQPRTSLEQLSDSPRGTLSDAAIVALGATPGSDPASLLNENGAALSSKNILTIALQKAQSAVQLDSANNVPEAISAYKQAVRLLDEVMERIAPRTGRRSRPSREEERRRLLVIHNTYADRIRLLSMIYAPEVGSTNGQSAHNDNFAVQETDWLDRVRGDSRTDDLTSPTNVAHGAGAGLAAEQSSFLPITPLQGDFQPRFTDAISSTVDATTPRPETRNLQQREQPPLPTSLASPPLQTSPQRRGRNIGRPESRDSRNSRTSISMSIADEQEVRERALAPPRIEEEVAALESSVRASGETSLDRTSSTGLSDPDNLGQRPNVPGRLRAATMRTNRAFGVDDDRGSPVTPYFDAAADANSQDSQFKSSQAASTVRRSKTAHQQRERTESSERPSKMGFAQRARALSFKGPLLRQKMSMPMLSERKTADRDSNDAAAAAARDARRPSSADSPPEDLTSSVRMQSSAPNDPFNLASRSVFGSNRPRAATSVAGTNLFSSSAADLGTFATQSGTIGQRRKHAGINANGQPLSLSRKSSDVSSELRQLSKQSPAVVAFPASDVGNDRSVPLSPFNRARSLSQPGSKRPAIPASLLDSNDTAHPSPQAELPPPVPDLARKLSALELSARSKQAVTGTEPRTNYAATGLSLPLPELDADKGAVKSSSLLLISDIFPTGLPSLAAGAPSYASVQVYDVASRRPKVPVAPHVLLRPYFVMQQLMVSIQQGAQVTDRLFVPQALWTQAGVKLTAVETKVRAIELLASGIEAVERGGEALLLPLGSNAGLETSSASRFLRQLEDFEGLLVAVQSNLAKKLAFLESKSSSSGAVGGGTPSKGSKSLSTFSSRLTRIAGVGQAKTQDTTSIMVYVETLAKLFRRSATLAAHTTSLLVAQGILPPTAPPSAAVSSDAAPPSTPTWLEPLRSPIGPISTPQDAYAALPAQVKHDIQTKLTRSSDFFARVVLTFVLQDLGIMMDKYVKKGSTVFAD